MPIIQEELQKTFSLLKQEWEEDLRQYKEKFASASLAEKKAEGVCWHPVILKQAKQGFGERFILSLERTDSPQAHAFQSGKSVTIFCTHPDYSSPKYRLHAVINQVKKDLMTVTLQGETLPNWLQFGRLGIDLLFDETSYREMEAALKSTIASKNGKLAELKRILLGEEAARLSEIKEFKTEGLNEGQNRALMLTDAAKEVAIIHGPPGTGKTTTLIAAIIHQLNFYPQVLVCAPSNAAVDLLVEKLVEQSVATLRIGHPARVDDQILSQTIDAKITQHPNYKDLKRVKKSADELRKMAFKYKRNFGSTEKSQRRRLLDESKRCREEAEQLESYIIYDIFQQTQVIATTLVGAANSILKGMSFPVVFIDEAGQGLEAATWIPIQKASKVVLAGDHQQLPPTIKSYEAAKAGMAETLFEKIIKRQPDVSTMLQIQYRMPALIQGFSSSYFYQNSLIPAKNTESHYLSPDEPVLEFIDTAGSGFTDQLEEETLSTYNLEEARFALNHLENLIKRIGIKTFKENAWDIGLISPYRAQVRRWNELLFETFAFPNLRDVSENLTIDSIDGFQGQERDIVLISLVRSNAKGEIGFLSDTRRMNVALTRAKRKLIVIGDSATLSLNPFYGKYLDYVEKHNCYKSVYEFME